MKNRIKNLFIYLGMFNTAIIVSYNYGCGGAQVIDYGVGIIGAKLLNSYKKGNLQPVTNAVRVYLIPFSIEDASQEISCNLNGSEATCEKLKEGTYRLVVERSQGAPVEYVATLGPTTGNVTKQEINLYLAEGVAEPVVQNKNITVYPRPIAYNTRILSPDYRSAKTTAINASSVISYNAYGTGFFGLDYPDGTQINIPRVSNNEGVLYVNGLSNANTSAGVLYDPSLKDLATQVRALPQGPGYWTGDGLPILISPGSFGTATCISDQWIGGVFDSPYLENGTVKMRDKFAFRVRIGGDVELLNGVLGSNVQGIRSDGFAVGRSVISQFEGVYWLPNNATPIALPKLNDVINYSIASCVANNANYIAGYAQLLREAGNGEPNLLNDLTTGHAILWKDLTSPPIRLDEGSYKYSIARCISPNGNYVGGFVANIANLRDHYGCIWSKQLDGKYKLYVLNDFNLDAETSKSISDVFGVNDSGEIAGIATPIASLPTAGDLNPDPNTAAVRVSPRK
jgi:hypothetical protein